MTTNRLTSIQELALAYAGDTNVYMWSMEGNPGCGKGAKAGTSLPKKNYTNCG